VAESVPRYHLSPHSADAIGISVLTEKRVQAPDDFDGDAD
jgi:hypothetical protein